MKRVKKPAAYLLARSLRRRWHAPDAGVLADWCEEHGLAGTAKRLRRGPSIRTRRAIEEICRAFGMRELRAERRFGDRWWPKEEKDG